VIDSERGIDTFNKMRYKRLTLELAIDEALCRGANDNGIGFG
jgi:hypothetical protein